MIPEYSIKLMKWKIVRYPFPSIPIPSKYPTRVDEKSKGRSSTCQSTQTFSPRKSNIDDLSAFLAIHNADMKLPIKITKVVFLIRTARR
jgi:hypothetical protein